MRGSRAHEMGMVGRAEKRSIGLGLPFCRSAVEAHGVRLRVESEPGHGSTFPCALPVSEAQ